MWLSDASLYLDCGLMSCTCLSYPGTYLRSPNLALKQQVESPVSIPSCILPSLQSKVLLRHLEDV